jgi:hypothetical protein
VDAAKKIAEAVLYEGYLLWPYRRSARKNQQRWTFGGVYPKEYSVARGEDDPWIMQTQCLLQGDERSTIEVGVRFLHVVERKVAKKADEALEFVDELRVGGERCLAWDEAAEREIAVGSFTLSELLISPKQVEIDIPGGSKEEPLAEPAGGIVGALVRSWRPLRGSVEVRGERVRDGTFRVTVRIANTTPWGGEEREGTLRQTFVSTHTTLRVEGGGFVSLMDPPEDFAEAVEGCENLKTWPVLVGEEEERSTMLSSPIILYDYPQIAPESPGDLFDGTEIDQMLILNVLNLTDEEKEEMRASDPRGREILERCESLSPEDLMKLNGTFRDIRMLRG